MADGHFTRAQIVAAFWGLFGFYMAGYGTKQYAAAGLDVASAGYVVLGALGFVLAAFYVRNPGQVADGDEHLDRRAEAVVAFVLVFVAVLVLYVLLA